MVLPSHMPVEKLSVSLAPDEIAWVRRKAEESASNVSAVLAEAVRQQRRLEAIDALLAELGTDDITAEDVAAVFAEWRAGVDP
jgi:K+/H+ antiporter YhaU regulatory subunit KhtT